VLFTEERVESSSYWPCGKSSTRNTCKRC